MNEKRTYDVEELRIMLEGGMSVEDAATELGMPPSTIYQRFMSSPALVSLREQRDQAVIKDYQARDAAHPLYKMREVLRRHEISQATLYSILRRNDTPFRRGASLACTTEEEDHIIRLYKQEATLRQIGKATGRSQKCIYDVLHRRDVPLRSQP